MRDQTIRPAISYTMIEENGKVVIYSGKRLLPWEIDIRADFLPSADREKLASGITVHSRNELLGLIEDMNS